VGPHHSGACAAGAGGAGAAGVQSERQTSRWRAFCSPSYLQTAMWDRITAALAQLGPAALALDEGQEDMDVSAVSQEALVEYEGMLISAAAAQRRRWMLVTL